MNFDDILYLIKYLFEGIYILKKKISLFFILFAATLSLSSCANNGQTVQSIDKFETYNRAMFSFNYQVDKYVFKPVATGYRNVTNQYTRDRVNSVLLNLTEPLIAVNHMLQGDPKESGKSLSRFVINTTLGLVGMYDVAKGWGIEPKPTLFNQTLAKWCVKDGPFIVLPLLGPSTPRAATSLMLDIVANPIYFAIPKDANIRDKIKYTYTAVGIIALREKNIELLDDLENNSVDFYAAVRSAYLQNQSKNKCYNAVETTETYDFDFNDEIYEENDEFDEM